MESGIQLQRSSTNFAKLVDEIVKLEKKTFPKHESLARSFDEEMIKKNSGLLYTTDLHGEVIGYVMYSWPSSLSASITKLAVKETHRGKGHGEALLKAAIQKCRTRNVHRISLHVDPLRTPAMLVCQKLGFQVDSLVKSYYAAIGMPIECIWISFLKPSHGQDRLGLSMSYLNFMLVATVRSPT